MPTSVQINLRAQFVPPAPAGTANAQGYSIPLDLNIPGTTDTMVQLEMTPADYAAGGTDPNMVWELAGGSSPMNPVVTAGTWNAKVLIDNVNGETQDWSAVRTLCVRAMAAVEGDPAECTGVIILGNDAGSDHHRLVLPLNFNSSAAEGAAEGGGIIAIPGGLTWSVSYPLKFILYSCTNLRLLAALRGA